MQVALVSNIPHFHHLASALADAGMLHCYVTAAVPLGSDPVPSLLPWYWRLKFEGRRLTGVSRERVHRIWIAEALQKSLPRLRLASPERANWLNNHLFDRLALRYLQGATAVHFVSSLGLSCARWAKRRALTVVCDSRQGHQKFHRQILEEEAQRWNYRAQVPGGSYEERVLDEYALADHLVVPSEFAARTFVMRGFDRRRIAVNPYGVALEHFWPAQKQLGQFRALFVGQLTPCKGLVYLLEAWRRLRLPGAELVLIGSLDPVLRPTLARFEGLFRYLEAVPKLELRCHYQQASVLILPSLSDAFGLVVLEAMACGCPVIVSENTGAADAVADGDEGFVVPIRDVDALSDRLLRLHRDADLRLSMGERAARKAQRYTWEAYGRRAVQFYQRLQAGGVSHDQPLPQTCSKH